MTREELLEYVGNQLWLHLNDYPWGSLERDSDPYRALYAWRRLVDGPPNTWPEDEVRRELYEDGTFSIDPVHELIERTHGKPLDELFADAGD